MLALEQSDRAGKLKKPSRVADGNNRPEDSGGRAGGGAGEVDGGHLKAVRVDLAGGTWQVAGSDRGKLNLTAPTIDVGEITADRARKGRDRQLGGGAGLAIGLFAVSFFFKRKSINPTQ